MLLLCAFDSCLGGAVTILYVLHICIAVCQWRMQAMRNTSVQSSARVWQIHTVAVREKSINCLSPFDLFVYVSMLYHYESIYYS